MCKSKLSRKSLISQIRITNKVVYGVRSPGPGCSGLLYSRGHGVCEEGPKKKLDRGGGGFVVVVVFIIMPRTFPKSCSKSSYTRAESRGHTCVPPMVRNSPLTEAVASETSTLNEGWSSLAGGERAGTGRQITVAAEEQKNGHQSLCT